MTYELIIKSEHKLLNRLSRFLNLCSFRDREMPLRVNAEEGSLEFRPKNI
jgi:hypothetical protein